ncbi:MAG TPA: MalY/PatB family protein [Candidatus Methylomirabilis sp.]|nr:MalY/PatB family protein [Candidatus Methylomirabilis sp.]
MTYDFDRVIDRRQTESNKWHKYPADVLPLWVADMDFRSPEPVIRALRDRVEHGIFGYGMEQPEFYEVILERLVKRYGWRVPREAILLIPGVIPGFNLAARAFTATGDGLLLQTPMYPPIRRVPENVGLSSDAVELTRQPDGRYVVDFERFEAAITSRTRIYLLCNPHNPVGRVYGKDELERMAQICLRHRLLICADEIHCDLTFSGQRHIPIASLDPEIEARTITLMAPTKTFNLPGLKCSIAIIPNASLRERFVAAQLDLVRAVNILGYTATVAAYRDGQPWLDELLRYLEANRDFVVDYVRSKLPGLRVAPPEATYLAWLDCRDAKLPHDDPYTFFLDQARVALNDGQTFGPGGAGFARLNFACPRATLTEALNRMRQALEQRA